MLSDFVLISLRRLQQTFRLWFSEAYVTEMLEVSSDHQRPNLPGREGVGVFWGHRWHRLCQPRLAVPPKALAFCFVADLWPLWSWSCLSVLGSPSRPALSCPPPISAGGHRPTGAHNPRGSRER